jgi:hypothetical protein
VGTPAGPCWGRLAWCALCLALGLPALLLPVVDLNTPPSTWAAPLQALALRPDQGWHQPAWVHWSAAWLHGSEAHRWRNLAALALLGWTGHLVKLPPRGVLALALAWPLTQMGMLWQTELGAYGGLSGVLHAIWTVVALHLIQPVQRRGQGPRATGAAMLAALCLKVMLENPWQMRAVPSLASAINVTPWVHFWGALMGALVWALVSLWHRHRTARPDSTD